MRKPAERNIYETALPYRFGPAFRRGAGVLGLLALAAASTTAVANDYGPRFVPVAAVIVQTAPPPLRTEVIPRRPGPHYVWQRGYWAWRGHWAWVAGVWVVPPRHGVAWVPGHWRHVQHRGWTWVPGHWR
jgi:hypothetical protein